MKHLGRLLVGVVISIGTLIPILAVSTTEASAASSPLTLISPWTGAPFATNSPQVSIKSGVVSFKGAIAAPQSNTSNAVFVLPTAYRPAVNVFAPVDMCGATNGRLIIEPSGDVFVQEQDGALTNADCFTSLDGASFVKSSAVTPLSLVNGWGPDTVDSVANPAAALLNGVVHFQGAMTAPSPTSTEAFVLPSNMTPSVPVYIAVDMNQATNGRLIIEPNGEVFVQEEDGGTTNEDIFTSLDGASFVVTPHNPTLLTLKSGWTGQSFGTAAASAELAKGVVRFGGAISGGSAAKAFTLPSTMRPTKTVYIKVDLCNATNGRLQIKPSGVALVEEEGGGLTNATCFTSLDGASFVK
jgi:hypothetical protein